MSGKRMRLVIDRRGRSIHIRRGVAVISFVVALLVIGTLVLWLLQLTASTSIAALGHYFGTCSFYAAESGIEMAVRELRQENDIDSDGQVGTISHNGDAGDDPAMASGAFYVGETTDYLPIQAYQAIGRPTEASEPWNAYRRMVEIQLVTQ